MKTIWSNILLKEVHNKKKAVLVSKFPILENCPHDHYLSLFSYISQTPECFFSERLFHDYFSWFEKRHKSNPDTLKEYISNKNTELNRAFHFLREINQYQWHDSIDEFDEYETIRFIDQQIHPTYLRLLESVFFHFVHILAFFSRIDRGKSPDGLDIYNVVEELKNSIFSKYTELYKNIVRNGIAHGGITYLQNQVQYNDKNGNRITLSNYEIFSLVDNLLDACNSLSLGIKVFILSHITNGYTVPKQVLIEELQAETDSPWWHIVGCTPSMFESQNQLIIYARPNSRDFFKVQYSAFLSGVLAEYFAPGYDRYFFSLRSQKALPGWAAFNGKKLKEIRNKNNLSIEDYKGILENDLVFYVPNLKLPWILSVNGK